LIFSLIFFFFLKLQSLEIPDEAPVEWSRDDKAAASHKVKISPQVSELVEELYKEAESALSNTLGSVQITAKGIRTPLGVVTLRQIEKGEKILEELYELFNKGDTGAQTKQKMVDLSNSFYTIIVSTVIILSLIFCFFFSSAS